MLKLIFGAFVIPAYRVRVTRKGTVEVQLAEGGRWIDTEETEQEAVAVYHGPLRY